MRATTTTSTKDVDQDFDRLQHTHGIDTGPGFEFDFREEPCSFVLPLSPRFRFPLLNVQANVLVEMCSFSPNRQDSLFRLRPSDFRSFDCAHRFWSPPEPRMKTFLNRHR